MEEELERHDSGLHSIDAYKVGGRSKMEHHDVIFNLFNAKMCTSCFYLFDRKKNALCLRTVNTHMTGIKNSVCAPPRQRQNSMKWSSSTANYGFFFIEYSLKDFHSKIKPRYQGYTVNFNNALVKVGLNSILPLSHNSLSFLGFGPFHQPRWPSLHLHVPSGPSPP